MDCKAEIRQWLDSEGSYQAGVNLLRRSTGKVPHQVAQYAKQPQITLDIYEELVNLLREQIPTGFVAPPTITRATQQEPDVILALRKRGILLKKREAAVHGKLKAYGLREDAHLFQEELHQLAKEMMNEVQPELDAVYGALREWKEEGKLPVPGKDLIIEETVRKMKRRESLKQMISKHRKALREDNLSEAEVKRIEADMQAKQEEQAAIEIELGL